ncbi:MAG: serine/threonine-protein kinase [Planctomycetes bacterium]|nr:serine/threonine-protein kinase [Planctomycetota bacterium]
MSERDPVEMLAEEFVARYRRGERPTITEYADRAAEQAERVRTTFPALVLMEDLAFSEFESFDDTKAALGFDEELPIEQLGEYRIIREIGRGGMGIVYEAEQLTLGRHVALKVLSQRALKNPKQKRRFELEARAAARLHHTNIVPVFDVGEYNGLMYYTMQYIQGAGMDAVLDDVILLRSGQLIAVEEDANSQSPTGAPRRSGSVSARSRTSGSHRLSTVPDSYPERKPPTEILRDEAPSFRSDTETHRTSDTWITLSAGAVLPGQTEDAGHATYWESVARVGVQVADALAYAHAQGIMHRDIKPSNLILDGHGTVWITDFGLAKLQDEEDLTNTGDFVGTLRYMAPERFGDEDQPAFEADPRSDVYSLGLTLYELLALKPAFDEADRHRLMRQVMEGEPTRLRKVAPAVPRDLETIVHKAIERDPAHRYQTGGELAADLRRYLDDEPIRARRVLLPERFWRWCRRNPKVSWTAGIAAMMIVATFIAAFIAISIERNNFERLAGENEQLAERERGAKQQVQAALVREKDLRSTEARLRTEAEQARDRAEQSARELQAVTDYLTNDIIGLARPEFAQGQALSMRSILDFAAGRVEHNFANQPATEAAVRNAIGHAYITLGDYKNAESQLTAALAQRRRLLGDEHQDTLATLNNLSLSLSGQGRFAEGQKLQEQVVASLREQHGDEDLKTLNAINNLAATHYQQGQLDEAQRLQEKSLETLRNNFGPRHVDTIRTLTNLAATLHGQRLYDEAQKLMVEAFESRRGILADTHPLTLTIASNMVQNLNKLGRFAEAERLGEQAYRHLNRLLGANHSTTLKTLGFLAQTYDSLGRHSEAQEYHQRVLSAQSEFLGPEHPDTLTTRNNLAACLLHQKRFVEAEHMLRDLVEIYRRKHGDEHPATLSALNNLARAYHDQGMLAVAQHDFRQVVETAERVLGPDDLSTLQFRISLAENLQSQKLLAEAEAEFAAIHQAVQNRYGREHRYALNTARQLARAMAAAGNYEKAEPVLRDTLELQKKTLPAGHWLTAATESLLGECLMKLGKHADAEPLLVDSFRRLKDEGSAPADAVREAHRRVVELYEGWGRPEEADRWRSDPPPESTLPAAPPAEQL